MVMRHVWLVPVAAVFFAALSFFIPYGIAISQNHTDAWLPYISDGGARKPESCIFGQLLNICAFLTAIAFYIRHRQITEFYYGSGRSIRGANKVVRIISLLLFIVGLFIVLGITLVANFQESQIEIVHSIGAMMSFFLGMVYVWSQSLLPAIARPRMSPYWLTALRIVLCTIATGFLALHVVCLYASPFVKEGPDGEKPKPSEFPYNIDRFDRNSPFYTNHLWTTGAEWAMVIAYELALLTLAVELRSFKLHAPSLQLINRRHIAPQYDSNGLRVSYIPRVNWPEKNQHIHIDYIPNNYSY